MYIKRNLGRTVFPVISCAGLSERAMAYREGVVPQAKVVVVVVEKSLGGGSGGAPEMVVRAELEGWSGAVVYFFTPHNFGWHINRQIHPSTNIEHLIRSTHIYLMSVQTSSA